MKKLTEGATVTASGLAYKVINKGSGKVHPNSESTVTVHYTGKLSDGQVFDSSVDRGEPATFPLNKVIPGWTEGVQLMVIGDKWTFIIPSNLAYGERGMPQAGIGSNATLIFEVELLEIKAADIKEKEDPHKGHNN
jgi:FKBP-type peptidyl-prolyl cis-trans isomerase